MRILAITEFAGTIMFITIEFFEHMDIFTSSLKNFSFSIAYLFLKLPYYINLILPLSFLISILVILILMIRSNELLVIRTSGISTVSLMKPMIYIAVLLILFSFIISEFVMPTASNTAEYIYRIKIKKEEPYVFFKNDSMWFKKDNIISNIELFDVKKDIIKGLTVVELTETYSIKRRIDAKEGMWKDGVWVFTNVIERTFDRNGIKSVKTYPKMNNIIQEPPSVFKVADKNPEEMGYKELSRYIRKLQQNGHDIRRYLVDLYNKISFPFINLIMVFAACSVGLRYRKTKHISMGIFTGISLGMLYWVFHSVSLAFGYSDIFPPLFAAWFSNCLFFSAGIVGIITLRT